MQKYGPRSHVGIFRNEPTQSTPLDPKLMFSWVLYHLGGFGTVWLPYETRCQTGRTSAKLRATKSHRNFLVHLTLNSCFTEFCTIWLHLEPFGCLTKLGAKRVELVQKFVPWSRVRIFRNERTRSSPLDPKLMFWCVLYYFCALSTVWLRYENHCKIGRTSAKVRATKSRRNFLQRTQPIHPIGL